MIQALDNPQCRSFPTEHYLDMVGDIDELSTPYVGIDTPPAPIEAIRRNYYVYARYLHTGTICYIGKGCASRINDGPKRQPRGLAEIMLLGLVRPGAVKLRDNLTEDEAYAIEVRLIAQYGRIKDGGILVNRSSGGSGPRGCSWSAEQRAAHSSKFRDKKLSPERVAAMRDIFAKPEVREKMRASALKAHAEKYLRLHGRTGRPGGRPLSFF